MKLAKRLSMFFCLMFAIFLAIFVSCEKRKLDNYTLAKGSILHYCIDRDENGYTVLFISDISVNDYVLVANKKNLISINPDKLDDLNLMTNSYANAKWWKIPNNIERVYYKKEQSKRIVYYYANGRSYYEELTW